MIQRFIYFIFVAMTIVLLGCKSKTKKDSIELGQPSLTLDPKKAPHEAPKGMVWVPGGEFHQGAVSSDKVAMAHEKPAHKVYVDGFFMDIHEVTNAQFAQFVEETGYVTVAERKIKWEEIKEQLPKDTPKPPDSILQPGSLVFRKTKSSVPNLYDYSQWWEWRIGANWKQPYGPGSDIQGKDEHPVVHVAYEDALAYCDWAGRRLPTEAEWEYAARAERDGVIYFWGDDFSQLSTHANTWEGEFPVKNTQEDGFERTAPVMSYPQNNFGLYDMAGNVWEWTGDWYHTNYYQDMASNNVSHKNPQGAEIPFNSNNPYAREKIIKGGSFLCSASYCASYRISARMATSPDSGMEHLGFRTVFP
ncbi:formylglycine-generating enzyme family protein [Flagellimonas sp.]|jgi:formylglycine-generating enzyme required for sulfatase activity|uniref:formylglycine-generating enzyme family protein n=1 Tax=Flagellimonas sp. TaxID=2058762 RepID=UPI003BACBCDB